MSITDENTVFVIGAGTSAPFGLSLGGDLITTIANSIRDEDRQVSDLLEQRHRDFVTIAQEAVETTAGFKRFPIYGTILYSHWNAETREFEKSANEEIKKLAELGDLLENQTSETIDDFIVENPTYGVLAKRCIATLFFLSCCDVGREITPKRFEARYYPEAEGSRNWVHLLINIVRQGIRAGQVSAENRIKIVTFNYDTVLEYVLDKQFSNTERRMAHWTDYVEVSHVHGQCGSLNELNGNPARICCEWADGIHVVNEAEVPAEITESRARAAEIVQSANELYFCGFAFSGPNCRLLRLSEPMSRKKQRIISFCNYDGNVGISKIVSSYKGEHNRREVTGGGSKIVQSKVITEIEEAKGTIGNPLGIADWLKLGYLGELPA